MALRCTSWKGGDVWCKNTATHRINTLAMTHDGEEYEKTLYSCDACLPSWERRPNAEIEDFVEEPPPLTDEDVAAMAD